MTATLTERRAADRARMAAELTALAARYGATAATRDGLRDPGRELRIEIEHPSFLCVSVDLQGCTCQAVPDTYVIPWHMRGGPPGRRLAPSFGAVNPYHGRKATHVVYGWEALRAEIERGLSAAADGSAFVAYEGAES